MSTRHTFRVPIGDWSGDGHSKADWYDATAAKPIESVRAAYFAAKDKHPALCPEEFCRTYEDDQIDRGIVDSLRAAGAPLPDLTTAPGDDDMLDGMTVDAMAAIVVWFLNQGDPDLDARLEERSPMLPFYGFDAQGRHIGFIGYGLLGS